MAQGGVGGGVVARVRPGSIAAEVGIEPGDRVRDIGGTVPEDFIDYRYLTAEPRLELRVIRPDGAELIYDIEKDPDEDLGLEFTEDVFGGRVKICGNKCLFCFVDRLPAHLRPALYLKDDDYRLSFLHGNFVTLSNLTRADLDRILALHLSPLYVSVHATEPELRAALLGSPRAAGILGQLRELIRGGVQVHAQVVVCPGLNDGVHLERTIADLAGLRPGVLSVGVVPVGLTAFGPAGSPVRPATAEEKAAALAIALAWHDRLGGFVYPGDEYFLGLGRPLPPARFYDDYPQLENGIGLGRVFLQDLAKVRRRRRPAGAPGAPRPADDPGAGDEPFLVVTGSLARSLVEEAVRTVAVLAGRAGETLEVANDFLGPLVTVAGLLAGADIRRAVARHGGRGPVLVPGAALRAGSDEFLDGTTLAGLARDLGRPFLDAGWLPSHMLAALETWYGGEAVGQEGQAAARRHRRATQRR